MSSKNQKNGLPKPVPFRMKPKKKLLTLKGRKTIVYILALLTIAYLTFSTLSSNKDQATDYQLASPNEFVGIKKGKMSDYDDNVDDSEIKGDNAAAGVGAGSRGQGGGQQVVVENEKVYNVKKPKAAQQKVDNIELEFD